jgi:small subunit ribosomal protein S16
MLVIRLARQGRNKYPVYRIVAAESARAATSKFVAILGHYNPHTKELVIQKEEVVKHLGNGAQPSNSVIKLLQREKIELPQWVELKTRDRKPKKEPVVKEAAPVAEAAEEATEAPAEETVEAVTETPEEAVVAVAEENAEAVEAEVTEAAPEDTAAGEEAQVEAAEATEDAAAEAAAEPTE